MWQWREEEESDELEQSDCNGQLRGRFYCEDSRETWEVLLSLSQQWLLLVMTCSLTLTLPTSHHCYVFLFFLNFFILHRNQKNP